MAKDDSALQRILLCRPASGLHDNICQIDLCCRHAERFERVVIVETDYQSSKHVRDSFSNYFVSTDPNLILDAGPYRDLFDRLDVTPSGLFGRVTSAACRFQWGRGYVDSQTDQSMAVDLSIDHAARLLVYHSLGSHPDGFRVMAKLRLHPDLAQELVKRLGGIERPYCGIHIRNTDYKTDYEQGLEAIKTKIDGPIFLATDDRHVLEYARALFGESRVYSFATFPGGPARPLHGLAPEDNAYERNADAILDLMMLALAKDFYGFRLIPNSNGIDYSGYALLAAKLRQAPKILQTLLSGGAGTGHPK